MRFLVPLALALSAGCGRNPKPTPAVPVDGPKRVVVKIKAEQPTEPVRPAPREKQKVAFDEREMVRPLTEIDGFPVGDYRKLPNCLAVFADCLKVPAAGKTAEQYRLALLEVARRPCRVELKVRDVPSGYDFAEFELLADDGTPALSTLKAAGDLGGYTSRLKEITAINNIKAKGLDVAKRSPGDRVTLVGLGYVVDASPWGAARPTHGLPRGDSRQVMLRAFGETNRGEYPFGFMVRNWYIAAQ
ncbi:MAG: hypothetical protein K2X82_30915 [Gemmataceae bacterium]|nr:hypothetical protein [Gemmataceae bacterium]